MVFDRILTARHSIANRCFAQEGDVLYFIPRKTVPKKDFLGHHFVSVQNPSVKSKYGWVSVIEPVSLDDFLRIHFRKPVDEIQRDAIYRMLSSILKLPEGTPVSIQYVQRGVEQKNMELSIHKVFFYDSKKIN